MGHDLGHTPFGHAGERILNELSPHGFHHYEQGLRVVDCIENEGRGLNLTYEVRDGILKHTNRTAETLEGCVVRYADVIAYINHDIDDSVRGGIICEEDIPKSITSVLGNSKSERITTLVNSLVENGVYMADKIPDGGEMPPAEPYAAVGMSSEVELAYKALHAFMFESVYRNPKCKSEEAKAQAMIEELYKYFSAHLEKMPALYINLAYKYGIDQAVCDYISGMSDSYAVDVFTELFVPAMTGCVSSETRDEIIECLKDDGYIGESDTFEYSLTDVSDLLPMYESYNYIYSNDNEEKYNIKIDADSDEGVYTVDILYGVEICETQYVIDGEEKTNYNVTDYDSKDILTVTEKSFLFF